VTALCGQAACDLPADVRKALQKGLETEKAETPKDFFAQYLGFCMCHE
jgi:hypothetical protein